MTAKTYRAALPLYDWPEVQHETEGFWQALRGYLPLTFAASLDRSQAMSALYQRPVFGFGNACALTSALPSHQHLRPFAKIITDSENGTYHSKIIVNAADASTKLEDLGDKKFTANGRDSLSGYLAWRSMARKLGFERPYQECALSGAHRNSLKMVANNIADFAIIDSNCWRLAQKLEPEAVSNVVIIGETEKLPAPPFVIPKHVAPLSSYFFEATNIAMKKFVDQFPDNTLGWRGVSPASLEEYADLRRFAHYRYN